jgi:hypothetical protein
LPIDVNLGDPGWFEQSSNAKKVYVAFEADLGCMRLRSAARRTSSLVAGRPGLEWGADSFMPFHSKPQRLRDTLRFSA